MEALVEGRTVTIAKKYRLVRRLAQGGMGVVYEAIHEQTGRPVALKLLLPGVIGTQNDGMVQRFEREARASGALDSPHITGILDAGVDDEGSAFLVMELLRGTDVLKTVEANGPLVPEVAVEIARQACAGLVCAHEAGVVHRDVKSANLFLAEQRDGKITVKVLDFGIAKVRAAPNEGHAITKTGALLGSPLYMSPEQILDGKNIDARTDVWSLGVVLYEMLSGAGPHRPIKSFPRLALAIAQKPAPPLTSVAPWVPESLSALVGRALEIDRDKRFPTAQAMLDALTAEVPPGFELTAERIAGVPPDVRARVLPRSPLAASLDASVQTRPTLDVSSPAVAPSPRGARVRRLVAALAILVGAGAVVALSIERGADRSTSRATAATSVTVSPVAGPAPASAAASPGVSRSARRSIAVLGFRDISRENGQESWLSTALVEMLTAELAAGESLRIIPAERVERAMRDLEIPGETPATPEALARVGQNLGTDMVVTGSFFVERADAGASLRVQLGLFDTAAAESMASVVRDGSASSLLPLVASLGAELRRKLGVRDLSASERGEVEAATTTHPEALQLYAQGLDAQRNFEHRASRALFQKAVEADPAFALAYSALGRALSNVGLEEDARKAAKKALDLSAGLSREQKLWIQADYEALSNQWDRAAETYRALLTFFPDNIDYGIALAQVLTFGQKATDALIVLDTLRTLPPGQSDDPRIDFEEARAAHSLSDNARAERAAAAAMNKGRALGNRWIIARVGYFYGNALVALGRPKEGLGVFEEARSIAVAEGDKRQVANLDVVISDVHASAGKLALARKDLQAATAELEGLDIPNQKAGIGYYLATIDLEQGDLRLAESRLEAAVQLYRAAGRQHGLAGALPSLGHVRVLLDKLPQAEEAGEESARITEASGRKSVEAQALVVLGEVAAKKGDTEKEKGYEDKALELATASDEKWVLAMVHLAIGKRLHVEGKRDLARAAFEQAILNADAAQSVLQSAEASVEIAGIDLEDGRAADAEARGRDAVAVLHDAEAHLAEVKALELEARALAATGHSSDAKRAIEDAARLVAVIPDETLRARVQKTRVALEHAN